MTKGIYSRSEMTDLLGLDDEDIELINEHVTREMAQEALNVLFSIDIGEDE